MNFAPPLSAPDPQPFLDTELLQTLNKALGIALVAQWFVPWMGSIFSWDLLSGAPAFAMVWSLLGGAGLITLGFLPGDKLSENLRTVIAAGIGVIGLVSVATLAGGTPPGVPFFGFFAWFGILTAAFALFLWTRRGFTKLAWILLVSGLGAMVFWLLVPIEGTMPLVFLFKVFGASGINIVWRIFMFLLMLGFLGLGALAFLFVWLRKDQADAGWVRLLAWALLLYVPAAVLVLGVMGIFTSAWLFIASLHVAVLCVTYLVTTFLAGSIVVDHALDGTIQDLFK